MLRAVIEPRMSERSQAGTSQIIVSRAGTAKKDCEKDVDPFQAVFRIEDCGS